MKHLLITAALLCGVSAANATPINIYKCETDRNDSGVYTLMFVGENGKDGTAAFNLKGHPQVMGTYSPTNNNKTMVVTFETFTLTVNDNDTTTLTRTKDGTSFPMWCYHIHTLDDKDLDNARPAN